MTRAPPATMDLTSAGPPAGPMPPPPLSDVGLPAGPRPRGVPGDDAATFAVPVRRVYAFHPPGLLYVLVSLFLAIGAVNSQNNLLFWAFGMAIGGLIISGVVSGSAMMNISAKRVSPPPTCVGDPVGLRYEFVHTGRLFPAMALVVREVDVSNRPRGLRVARGFRGTRASDATRASLSPVAAAVGQIRPGERQTAWATPIALRRGELPLTGFSVTTTFPFGILKKSVVFAAPATVTVLPRRVRIDPGIVAQASVDGSGGGLRRAFGAEAGEFFALRDYVPGDSPRMISWKASARGPGLRIRQTTSASPPGVVLVLRGVAEEDRPWRLERAAALLAAIARQAAAARLNIALDAPAFGVWVPPGAGPAHAQRVLRSIALLGTRPAGAGDAIAPVGETPARGHAASAAARVVVALQGEASEPDAAVLLSVDEPLRWARSPLMGELAGVAAEPQGGPRR